MSKIAVLKYELRNFVTSARCAQQRPHRRSLDKGGLVIMDYTFLKQAHLTLRRGTLYKYKSLKGDNFDHVIEIIRDSLIYCPRPSQLNDDKECKPKMLIGDISDPTYGPCVESWARRCISHREPQPTEEQIRRELASLTQDKLNSMINEATESFHVEVNRRYRILSLADSVTNDYLWVNYANNYEGVCLGFFVDPLFGSAFQVAYTDTIAAFDITKNNGFNSLYWTMLIKQTRWEKEKEFRLIFGEPPMGEDQPLENQKLRFDPPKLISITFGHRVSKQHKQILQNLILSQPYKRSFFRVLANPRRGIKLREYFPSFV